MRLVRIVLIIGLVVLLGVLAYRGFAPSTRSAADTVTVYYSKLDGVTLDKWTVSLGPARDPRSVAFYAAVQAVAGPPSTVEAVRFPPGTIVRKVERRGTTAIVDLSGNVTSGVGGAFAEAGEFKALVWTLTKLPGISSVRITINGARVATLPGGHLELDEPLSRSNW
ncbi:MAG TPA: GerMN domain-containing protein [Candidatus Baltobacteraceae bacterium]|nr:GerMN domain-containing protein [Candidatus Baltobacteraceae bacterium]